MKTTDSNWWAFYTQNSVFLHYPISLHMSSKITKSELAIPLEDTVSLRKIAYPGQWPGPTLSCWLSPYQLSVPSCQFRNYFTYSKAAPSFTLPFASQSWALLLARCPIFILKTPHDEWSRSAAWCAKNSINFTTWKLLECYFIIVTKRSKSRNKQMQYILGRYFGNSAKKGEAWPWTKTTK